MIFTPCFSLLAETRYSDSGHFRRVPRTTFVPGVKWALASGEGTCRLVSAVGEAAATTSCGGAGSIRRRKNKGKCLIKPMVSFDDGEASRLFFFALFFSSGPACFDFVARGALTWGWVADANVANLATATGSGGTEPVVLTLARVYLLPIFGSVSVCWCGLDGWRPLLLLFRFFLPKRFFEKLLLLAVRLGWRARRTNTRTRAKGIHGLFGCVGAGGVHKTSQSGQCC